MSSRSIPATDLTFKEEITISSNRAQALNYRSLFWSSSDQKYLFIQNATPATSVSIVDLAAKKQIGEIPNPGCYGIFPSAKTPNRFATTCGDGTFGTIDVKADGTGEMKASGPIFDADADALFSGAFKWGDKWVFASYGGNIYVVDVEGETATLTDKIPVSAGIEGDWRPGGYQPIAVHSASGIAYLAHAFERRGRQPQEPRRRVLGRRSQHQESAGQRTVRSVHRDDRQPGRCARAFRPGRAQGRGRAL